MQADNHGGRSSGPTLAIHAPGVPEGFAPRWIEYCNENGLAVRTVDGFASDLLAGIADCDALLWHFDQNSYRDLLVARHILRAVADSGMTVFPDLESCWHFDDKIVQKYLFEAHGLPHVRTRCFYREADATAWIEQAEFPCVWKLRRGAGSANVRLLRDRGQALRLCRQAFGPGFDPVPADLQDFRSRVRRIDSLSDLLSKLKRRPALMMANRKRKLSYPPEMGYFLVQDFVPGNDFDTRITVVDGLSWGFRRGVRQGDFRASGSGRIDHDPQAIHPDCVRIARQAARTLDADCLAFDFVIDPDAGPLLVEMSYAFLPDAVASCPGYWDRDGEWREGSLRPEDVMVRSVLRRLEMQRG